LTELLKLLATILNSSPQQVKRSYMAGREGKHCVAGNIYAAGQISESRVMRRLEPTTSGWPSSLVSLIRPHKPD
jgi:hypothetical protein